MLLLVPAAAAFCGTYVGPAGAELESAATHTIIARNGTETALTVAPSLSADTEEFGMLIPVPEVVLAEDVVLVRASLLDRFSAYSAPRLVSYTCEDLAPYESDTDSDSDADADTELDSDADGVVVEASYEVGEYDISVLSATGAGGLQNWLDDHGFTVPDTAHDVLQEYIDAGQYFIAAKVGLSELPTGGLLSPLQFRYTSEAFSLPIRLGTTVSPGEQDLIVYALTPYSEGLVGIANYPEATLEDECMIPEQDSVDDVYASQLEGAFATGIWTVEYSWAPYGCDPCAADAPTEADLTEAGADSGSMVWFTRLHLRYAPGDVFEDLNLYTTGMTQSSQVRYIEYNRRLEAMFPICGAGMTENPGDCDDAVETDTGVLKMRNGDVEECGCSATRAPGVLVALVALALARRRLGRGTTPRPAR